MKEWQNRDTKNGIILPHESAIIPGTSIELTSRFYNPDAKYDTHPDHHDIESQMTF